MTPASPTAGSALPPWEALDGHALRVLEVLLTECNVSNAARRLNLSQPAVSLILKRLRQVLGDPLLVRGRYGMTLTERGAALLEPVRQVIRQLELITSPPETSQPGSLNRTFNVALPDFLSAPLIGYLIARLHQVAPGIHLRFHPLTSEQHYVSQLENGDLDCVIGNWPNPPEHLRMTPLFEDRVVCLMRRRHPLTQQPLTLEAYQQNWHILPTPSSVGERGVIDQTLSRLHIRRPVLAQLPYFHVVPYLLLENDAIFSCPRLFADHYCRLLDLDMQPPPVTFPPILFYILWHDRTHLDATARWLRQHLVEWSRERASQASR